MLRKSNGTKAKGALGPILLIVFAIWLPFHFIGCHIPTHEEKALQEAEEVREAMTKILYLKDQKTGLCFAVVGDDLRASYGYLGLANVPCEKVENFFYRVEEGPPDGESAKND